MSLGLYCFCTGVDEKDFVGYPFSRMGRKIRAERRNDATALFRALGRVFSGAQMKIVKVVNVQKSVNLLLLGRFQHRPVRVYENYRILQKEVVKQ